MADLKPDSKSLFSLDSYHVSEELGFILPEPLVSGQAKRINFPYVPFYSYILPDTLAGMMKYLIARKPQTVKGTMSMNE